MNELDKKDKRITIAILLSIVGVLLITLIVLLMVVFSKPKYEIKINTDGHKLTKEIIMKDNTIKELPEIELNDGEVLAAWVNKDNQAIRPGLEIKKPEEISPIIIIPEPSETLLKIHFDTKTSVKIPDMEVKKGMTIIFPVPPEYSDWIFICWLDKNGIVVTKDYVINEDTTFYAYWRIPSKKQVTISYDTGTEERIKSITVASGSNVALPTPRISKENSVFKGWLDEEGNLVDASYTVTKDITLKANWQPAYVCPEGCTPNTDGKTCNKQVTEEPGIYLDCPSGYTNVNETCLDLSRRYYSDHIDHDPWWTCSNPSDGMYDEVEYGGAIKWCAPKAEGSKMLACPEDLHLEGNACVKTVTENCTPN